MEHDEFWQKIESALRHYERVLYVGPLVPPLGGLGRGRRGQFIFLRFLFLVGLYVAAYYLPLSALAKIALTSIAGFLIADMSMAPTSIAFGGLPPMRPLQGLVLLFFNYISICIAFGLLYITLCRSSFNIDPDLIDLAYFSCTTMTALGLGDIGPGEEHHTG